MICSLVSGVLLLMFSAVSAGAEPRIALVVGNSKYQAISPLDNPVSDAQLISKALEDVGFDVTLVVDGDQATMKRAVADFGRKLRAAGPDAVSLFYYAGHGVQADGTNYLIPIDGVVQDQADLDLVGVQADWVLRQLFSARNRTNIVILDACRNNPFPAVSGMQQKGLAEMNAPTGTFIAYSAAPGSVALDGRPGANSPFSGALSEGIRVKGQAIEQVFKQVRISVVQDTHGQQTPWDSSSLTGEFFFAPADPPDPQEIAAEQLWNTVRKSGDSVQIILFLRQYPNSKVSEEARALLRQSLSSEIAPEAGAPPPPPAAPEPVPPPLQAVPAPVPPPALARPSSQEGALIARAQASGRLADYETYLQTFPDGVFATLAAAEIRALKLSTAPPDPAPGPTAAALPDAIITYLSPLTREGPIQGRSIAQIIEGSPQYPPVDGLPDSYWKTKTCSNCHHWNQAALCEQGKTYLTQSGRFALEKRHPLDGFKQVLRDWAAADCG